MKRNRQRHTDIKSSRVRALSYCLSYISCRVAHIGQAINSLWSENQALSVLSGNLKAPASVSLRGVEFSACRKEQKKDGVSLCAWISALAPPIHVTLPDPSNKGLDGIVDTFSSDCPHAEQVRAKTEPKYQRDSRGRKDNTQRLAEAIHINNTNGLGIVTPGARARSPATALYAIDVHFALLLLDSERVHFRFPA